MRLSLSCLRAAALGAGVVAVSGCANELSTPAGQLFCSVETVAGPVVFAAIDASTGGLAIIATGATSAYVAHACAAAKITAATSTPIPVSPPASPDAAPKIAVVVPTT